MLSSYDQVVGSLVVKSRVASGLPPLTNEELLAHTQAWAQILYGVVPENDLERSYLRAMRDKETTFALSAPEMVQAYRAECQSEIASPRPAQDANLLPGEVCQKCFGTGWEEFKENGYKQSRRCTH